MSEWLTQQEAAEAIGLSVRRLQQLRRQGLLTGVRNPHTRRTHYHENEVARFIEARAAGQGIENGGQA